MEVTCAVCGIREVKEEEEGGDEGGGKQIKLRAMVDITALNSPSGVPSPLCSAPKCNEAPPIKSISQTVTSTTTTPIDNNSGRTAAKVVGGEIPLLVTGVQQQ